MISLLTILATAGGTATQLFDTIRKNVLAPIGRGFDIMLAPIDAAFEPVADRFNDTLGEYFGELTGLQFAFLFSVVALLLTAGWWGSAVILWSGELVVRDIRRTLALACIWAVFAMGWDIQSGYTGYISFGHSVLSGGAAYTTALLLNQVNPDLSFWITAPISVLVAVVIGLLIALPSLRLKGPYFSLITFAAVLLFYQSTRAFDSMGGEAGLGIDRLIPVADPFMRYYILLIPMLLVAVGLTFLARSNLGLILVAIRENEDSVSAAGLNPTKFKIWSFVISSVVMGIGGVMLTAWVSNVDPTSFVVVDRSIEMIAMAVLGGMSSILGAMGGAFLFFLLREEIFDLFIDSTSLRNAALFILVIFVLVVARDGLFRRLWHRLGDVRGDEE